MDAQQIGDFLWGGVLSEAVACSVLSRIARSAILRPAERQLYARFADEEALHGRLLREAATQYTAAADQASRARIRTLGAHHRADWEALALVFAAERVATRSLRAVEAWFEAAGDQVAVRAYQQIARDEPAHIATSRGVLRRADASVQASIHRATAGLMVAYRAVLPARAEFRDGAKENT